MEAKSNAMKISQIAIYVPKQDLVQQDMEKIFGDLGFYSDRLKMDGAMLTNNSIITVYDLPLRLLFSHQLMDGVELEYITSDSISHWHTDIIHEIGNVPFLSHLGAYVSKEEVRPFVDTMARMGIKIIQDTLSKDHSNKRDDGSDRRYRDIVFDSRKTIGFNIKLSVKL